MNAAFEHLLVRAESLLARLEVILPHAATAPDWGRSVALRYRRRGSAGVLEPVKHVSTIRLSDLKEAALPMCASAISKVSASGR